MTIGIGALASEDEGSAAMTSKSNDSNWRVGQAFELGGAGKGKEKLESRN